jgi:predicted Zn-dependent peptidase
VEDVSKFFKTYYAPNNAVLSIAGDIQIAEAKKWIEAYFADIPSQPQPKHPDLAERSPKAREEVYQDKLAKVPAVIVGFPGPARRSADYYALGMADVLLTGGESSRIQQNLVKGKQSVINFEANLGWPFASMSDYKDPGLYAMYLMYNPRFKGTDIVAQVNEELDRLKTEPVGMKELERARTFLRAARIGELQRSMNRAQLLAQYELFDGKPELLRTELNDMLAVTPEQIQAAATKYFQKDRQITLQIVPAPAQAGKKEGE